MNFLHQLLVMIHYYFSELSQAFIKNFFLIAYSITFLGIIKICPITSLGYINEIYFNH